MSPSSGSDDLVRLPAAVWGNPRLAGLTWVRRGSLARIEPTPSSGEIPGRGGKLPGTYQVDADLAPFAEQSMAQGPSVLPIFIRQGGPRP
jgi:hypothetical protein